MSSNLRHIKLFTLLALFLLLAAWPGYAQGQSPLTAAVDRTNLSTDETLLLTVTVEGTGLKTPRPTLPVLTGFDIVGSSTSSQMSIINGDVSAQAIYSYRLRPTQAGDLVIEPLSLTINGQSYTTEPITIRVTQGSGQAPPAPLTDTPRGQIIPPPETLSGQEVFVEAEVDNPTPYLGQQVVYTFRFYRAINLFEQPQYNAPPFTGFWSEEQPDQTRYTAQAGGRTYRVTELRTALFPTAAGPVTIEAARLTLPGGLFRRDTILQTKAITLEVKPLPPDAPADFKGAVGQFTLYAQVDTAQGKVNEPVTLKVTLEGTGNLNTAPDPVWPVMSGWRSFESQASIKTETRNDQIGGSRVYERLLVPEAEGEFTIPSITYTYFDPLAAGYRTLSTRPIPVSVAPGPAEAPPAILIGGNKETVEQIAADIRHLKPAPPALKRATPPLARQPEFWLAWGIPLLAVAGNFAWLRWRQYRQDNPGLARRSQARKMALKALAQARKRQQDPYTAAGQILTTYIGDKLNRPVAGLTHRRLRGQLAENGLCPGLIERVEACLVTGEAGRFAPEASASTGGRQLLQQVESLIGELEKAL